MELKGCGKSKAFEIIKKVRSQDYYGKPWSESQEAKGTNKGNCPSKLFIKKFGMKREVEKI